MCCVLINKQVFLFLPLKGMNCSYLITLHDFITYQGDIAE